MGSIATPRFNRLAIAVGVGTVLATTALVSGCGSATSNSAQNPAPNQQVNKTVPAGSLNPNFLPVGSGLNAPVDAVATIAGGASGDKVMVGGRFTSYNKTNNVNYLARLNSDGSLDTKFNPTGKGLNARVRALAVQSDGKVLAGGEFTQYNQTAITGIIRLDVDGKPDTAFNPPPLAWNGGAAQIWSIKVQSDGKILLGGLFNKTDSSPAYLLRLNSDGSVDKTFQSAGFNGYIKGIGVQADGQVVVGGDFSSPRSNLARINSDGTLDPAFASGVAPLASDGYVDDVEQQSDGKLVIGGWFKSYDGLNEPQVARLNADGTVDKSFAPVGSGLTNPSSDAAVKALSVQKDGKVVVGGDFTAYDTTAMPYLARLNTDGSLDKAFTQTGTGLASNANDLGLTSSGNIAVAGSFQKYDTTVVQYVAEVFGSPSTVVTVPGAPTNVAAAAGDATASVSWTAPTDTGGSPITGYTATGSATGQPTVTCSTSAPDATKCELTKMTNGTQYSVTVTASNIKGASVPSSPPVLVTPVAPAPPGAPTKVSATQGVKGTLVVTWVAPASQGTAPITTYTATAADSKGKPLLTCKSTGVTPPATTCNLTNAVSGTTYSITATATNSVGTGPASAPFVFIPKW